MAEEVSVATKARTTTINQSNGVQGTTNVQQEATNTQPNVDSFTPNTLQELENRFLHNPIKTTPQTPPLARSEAEKKETDKNEALIEKYLYGENPLKRKEHSEADEDTSSPRSRFFPNIFETLLTIRSISNANPIGLRATSEVLNRIKEGRDISTSLRALVDMDKIERLNNLSPAASRTAEAILKPLATLTSKFKKLPQLIKFSSTAGEAATEVSGAAKVLGYGGKALGFVSRVGGRALPLLGAVIAGIDIYKDTKDLFTKEESGWAKAGKVANIGCTTTGAVIGGIIGSVIPGAGTVIGAMIGAGIGNLVGNFAKSCLTPGGFFNKIGRSLLGI